MKNLYRSQLAVAAALFVLTGAAFGQPAYNIDGAHSSAQFSVRHMMV